MFRRLACIALVLACPLAALAQQKPASAAPPAAVPAKPTPEEMRQIMQMTMGAMVSVMGPMTEAVMEAQLNVAARPEAAERLAAFKKNLFDALVKKGFTPEQALQIVLTTQLPAAAPAAK